MVAFLAMSFLVVGIMTDFHFKEVEIQTADSHYIFPSVKSVIYLAAFLYIVKNLFLLTDLLIKRSMLMAILFSVVNPIIALLCAILIYINIQGLITMNHASSNLVFPTLFLAGLSVLQVILQIRSLQKVRRLISNEAYWIKSLCSIPKGSELAVIKAFPSYLLPHKNSNDHWMTKTIKQKALRLLTGCHTSSYNEKTTTNY